MKSLEKTMNYYNAIAPGYKELYHEEQILKISNIKELIPKNGLGIDIGSGDGVVNEFIQTNFISLDLSHELLKLNSNKNKIVGSAMNLPFEKESFDFALSFTVFQDLPDPIKAIDEVKRILKKRGIFILTFLHMSKSAQDIVEKVSKEFKVVKEIKEIKDYIFVLKKRD